MQHNCSGQGDSSIKPRGAGKDSTGQGWPRGIRSWPQIPLCNGILTSQEWDYKMKVPFIFF